MFAVEITLASRLADFSCKSVASKLSSGMLGRGGQERGELA